MEGKRFCAHRGLSALMPENTLPAFGAALALGADEIEFDVRLTRDGKPVVCHDPVLERISDGNGRVEEHTLEEVQALTVGQKLGWVAKFCTPEEVFAQLANKITFNIHLKQHGEDGIIIRELQELTHRYNALKHVYFAGSPDELEWMEKLAPEIPRTTIQLPNDKIGIVEAAEKYHCSGVQFWLGMFDENTIRTLHAKNVRCNLFYADTEEDYRTYFDMGIDTLLTNRMDLAADFRNKNKNYFIK